MEALLDFIFCAVPGSTFQPLRDDTVKKSRQARSLGPSCFLEGVL
jgi:hypothetical protein